LVWKNKNNLFQNIKREIKQNYLKMGEYDVTILLNKALQPEYVGKYSIDATDFNEREIRNLSLVPNGTNGDMVFLDLIPLELKEQYITSGFLRMPIQAQANFKGLSGLRNLFSIFPENIKNVPAIKNITYYLEQVYQQEYQKQREQEQVTAEEKLKQFFPESDVCVPKKNPIPGRLSFISFDKTGLDSLKRMKYEENDLQYTEELVFKPGQVDILLALFLYRNGLGTRKSIMNFENPGKLGKTIELLYQIMVYGFDRIYNLMTSRKWETRGQILEYVPANKSARMLADVNIEQTLYVPKLEKSATPCPKCKNENNSQVTFQTRAADEPLTTKIICGNPHCRFVWHEEG
jgi:DNA-directed RNA polymerase subunit M/transcription elongation factor TFIIS